MPLFSGAKRRVLIADDDVSIRTMLGVLLGDAGWEVTEAGTGDEALRLALEQPPDLLLLDINMPGLTGVEALKTLRSNSRTKALPVVMCTARETLEDVEACLSAGANDYIQKPLDLKAILAKVEKLAPRR